MYDAFQYTIDNAGLDKEDIYPYKGKVSRVNNGVSIVINYYNNYVLQQGQCNYNDKGKGAAAAGIVQIPSGSEEHLQLALATAGPVSVAIDASSNAFRV